MSLNNGSSDGPSYDQSIIEKTLWEMGFLYDDCKNWHKIHQLSKTPLRKHIQRLVLNHIKPDAMIIIGSDSFECHSIVLREISDFFKGIQKKGIMKLDPNCLTLHSFLLVYEWMISERPVITRESVVQVYRAAEYLQAGELLNELWLYIYQFREGSAFLLYLEASLGGAQAIQDLMITHIAKIFLLVVSCHEFVGLAPRCLVALLESTDIHVNTEMEVFMAAVRWLTYDWQDRKRFTALVMSTVRFNALPLEALLWLLKCNETNELQYITAQGSVAESVYEAIGYQMALKLYKNNEPELATMLDRNCWIEPKKRNFVFDKNCKYHLPPKTKGWIPVSLADFYNYLEELKCWRKGWLDKAYFTPSELISCKDKEDVVAQRRE